MASSLSLSRSASTASTRPDALSSYSSLHHCTATMTLDKKSVGGGGGGGGRRRGPRGAKHSLPSHSSCPTPLAYSPECLASQLTLLDAPVFKSIKMDEFSSCGWTHRSNRLRLAPNIVEFIRRFNHVSFWTVRTILESPNSPRMRAETMAHMVKVAKRLHELGNLHAEYAILSALNSAPIFRLNRTWAALNRKERQTFNKLIDVFKENNNFNILRTHTDSLALRHQPCLPYLGIYLTDIVYIDMAHPHQGGLESRARQIKMNNVLRLLSEMQLQAKHYIDTIQLVPAVQDYLKSIRYIDELQKFIEDDHFNMSLRLEPAANSTAASSSSSKESVHSANKEANNNNVTVADLNLSPAKSGVRGGSFRKPFVPGHRKTKSDGANIFLSCTSTDASPRALTKVQKNHIDAKEYNNDDNDESLESSLNTSLNTEEHKPLLTSRQSRTESCGSMERYHHHHLIDDSIIQDDCLSDDGLLCDASAMNPGVAVGDRRALSLDRNESNACVFQGCVKRKTLLKSGRRPTLGSWQRYWLQLWGSTLVFFNPRPLSKAMERSDFRAEPCKIQTILGWCVNLDVDSDNYEYNKADCSRQSHAFKLEDPVRRSVYRFRAPSAEMARRWLQHLDTAVTHKHTHHVPTNLISFE